jgi:hypothetical protein
VVQRVSTIVLAQTKDAFAMVSPRGSIDRPEVSPYHAALQPFSATEVGAKLMRVYTVTQ